MSAKLVYSFSEECPEFHKQIGCMKGIFHLFDRRQLFASRRINASSHGPAAKNGNEQENVSHANAKLFREKDRVSVESATTSFSSSSSSANCRTSDSEPSLSSRQSDIHAAVRGSICKETIAASLKSPRASAKILPDLEEFDRQRFSPRLSYDERGSNSFKLKEKELPRLSLDSKRPSSVVAKLMGLEEACPAVPAHSSLSEKERRASGSPRTPRRESNSPRYKTSEISINGDSASSVYGEIQKRLEELEFMKSGKDLRALKQILGAMNKNNNDIAGNKVDQTSESPPLIQQQCRQRKKIAQDRIVIMKPSQCLDSSGYSPLVLFHKENASANEQKPRELTRRRILTKEQLVKPCQSVNNEVGLRRSRSMGSLKSSQPSTKEQFKSSSSESGSPRPHRKPFKIEKVSNVVECPPRKNSRTPIKEIGSRISTNDQQSSRRISEIDRRTKKATSKHRRDSKLADLAVAIQDQPSPISVLEAFCSDDSPSPVKKVSTAFQDDDIATSDEDSFSDHAVSLCQRRLQFDDKRLSDAKDAGNAELNTSVNQDHVYISEILQSSGFLFDYEHFFSGDRINPNLFLVLERKKKIADGRIFSATEKDHRKLIFDAVDEILGAKFDRGRSLVRCSSESNPTGKQLLAEVCSEIDELQAESTLNVSIDDDESFSRAVLLKDSRSWIGFPHEILEVVLYIERLIFKDLICDIVNGDAPNLYF